MWITSKVSVSIRPSLNDGRQVLGNITLTSLVLSFKEKGDILSCNNHSWACDAMLPASGVPYV